MKILIIGDIMIDIYFDCNTKRKAPEADIPIYNVINTEYKLGGASNVAKQLTNLKCNVEIISVLGDDIMGQKLQELLTFENIKYKIFIEKNRKTTQKNRIINNNNLINRYDIENTNDIEYITQQNIFDYICSNQNVDAIIISDYQKGVITTNLCELIINYANQNNIFTFIDPKVKDFIKYKNCFCFKPNLLEGKMITQKEKINDIINNIYQDICCKNVILTSGKDGIYLSINNNEYIHNNNYNNINIIDVTGAGDIVISIIVFIYLLSKDFIKACDIANFIARKSIQYIGNYNVSFKDIQEYNKKYPLYSIFEFDNYYKKLNIYTHIIYDHEIEKIKEIKSNNIVFTNGCFDIIHSAHIKLLNYAKSLDKIFIIGLNSDSSIKKIKGHDRPINNEKERIELLQNLNIANYIIVFTSKTPETILSYIKPNILVKGGDYDISTIIGKEHVNKICLFDYINNKSTSNIINKIKLLENI
jgi:D-beta-D-heptose 7-phosphate kinase/D-beta-D-heptose 1-phosphate adenosyltransferase